MTNNQKKLKKRNFVFRDRQDDEFADNDDIDELLGRFLPSQHSLFFLWIYLFRIIQLCFIW